MAKCSRLTTSGLIADRTSRLPGTEPKRNVTLIGDAAHVMPPYAGEGVNMAMLDALVLSRHLLSQDTSSNAIAAYEAEMFARIRHTTEDTMVNTEMFYAPDASDPVVALFRSFGAAEAVPPWNSASIG